MIIYLNKNCNGFKWFALENLEESEPNVLMTSPENSASYPTLGNIMLWEDFSIILIHENDSYILSLDGLEESGKDSFGRPLNMKIIFIDSDYEKIRSILFAYTGYKQTFDERINEIFSRESGGIRCNTDLLKSTLDNIYNTEIQQTKDFRCTDKKLMFVETHITNPEKFANHFNIDLSNVNTIFKLRERVGSIMGKNFMTSSPFDIKDKEPKKTPIEDPIDPKRKSLFVKISIGAIIVMAIALLINYLKNKS